MIFIQESWCREAEKWVLHIFDSANLLTIGCARDTNIAESRDNTNTGWDAATRSNYEFNIAVGTAQGGGGVKLEQNTLISGEVKFAAIFTWTVTKNNVPTASAG